MENLNLKLFNEVSMLKSSLKSFKTVSVRLVEGKLSERACKDLNDFRVFPRSRTVDSVNLSIRMQNFAKELLIKTYVNVF